MARVVTSDAAVQLITRLQADVDQLQESMNQMLRTGNELAAPQTWEGTAANQFRDNEWRETQVWAQNSYQQLTELRATVQRINENIMQAGGGLG